MTSSSLIATKNHVHLDVGQVREAVEGGALGGVNLSSRAEAREPREVMAFGPACFGSTAVGAPLTGYISEILDPRLAFVVGGDAALIAGILAGREARMLAAEPEVAPIEPDCAGRGVNRPRRRRKGNPRARHRC